MTTIQQEWVLVAQDQSNALEAFKALCKARYALHVAAKTHAMAIDWVSYGPLYGPAWATHSTLSIAGDNYAAAKQSWLEVA